MISVDKIGYLITSYWLLVFCFYVSEIEWTAEFMIIINIIIYFM